MTQNDIVIKPFVKWAGGKTKLLPAILPRVPSKYSRYIEPFVGAGALLFALQPKKALIADTNFELITAYRVLQDGDLKNLQEALSFHHAHYSADYFYDLRADHYTESSRPESIAARFIFLNKTCFNGLYRVNSRGLFNVPFGKRVKCPDMGLENLAHVSHYLQSAAVTIKLQSFRETFKTIRKNNFVYLDPPYLPFAQGGFTKYQEDDFTEVDQRALAALINQKPYAKILLSNSNTPKTQEIYNSLHREVVTTTWMINRNGQDRQKLPLELLMRNYEMGETE